MVESMVSSEPNPSESGEERRCEACGSSFVCGAAQKSCWCFGVALTDESRAKLSESYKACVCQTCLTKYTVTTASKAVVEDQ
jgi:hypothetical protein